MKFIKLNRSSDDTSLYIHAMMITCLQPLSDNPSGQTPVHLMCGSTWVVVETADEIKKLIADSEKFIMTY